MEQAREKTTSSKESALERELRRQCHRHQNEKIMYLCYEKQPISHGNNESINNDNSATILNSSRVCSRCVEERQIENYQLINLRKLFYFSNDTELLKIPYLSGNQITYEMLMSLTKQMDSAIEEVNSFFENIEEQLQDAIESARSKAKQKLALFADSVAVAINIYNDISGYEQLRQIVLYGEDEMKDKMIKEFFREKERQAQVKSQILEDKVDQAQMIRERFSTDVADEIARQAIEIIQDLDLFAGNSQNNNEPKRFLMNNLQLIPSQQYAYSKSLHITKSTIDNILSATLKGNNFDSQFYLNQLIDNESKYIFRIHLIQNAKEDSPAFRFGLLPDSLKDKKWIGDCYLDYCESDETEGIFKVIEGKKQVYSGRSMRIINRTLELRIHLKEKILKVASYPDYEEAVELVDKLKINIDEKYRLGFWIFFPKDELQLVYGALVKDFDERF